MSKITGPDGRPIAAHMGNGDRRAITKHEAKVIAEEIAVKVTEYYMIQIPGMVERTVRSILIEAGILMVEKPAETPVVEPLALVDEATAE